MQRESIWGEFNTDYTMIHHEQKCKAIERNEKYFKETGLCSERMLFSFNISSEEKESRQSFVCLESSWSGTNFFLMYTPFPCLSIHSFFFSLWFVYSCSVRAVDRKLMLLSSLSESWVFTGPFSSSFLSLSLVFLSIHFIHFSRHFVKTVTSNSFICWLCCCFMSEFSDTWTVQSLQRTDATEKET